MPKATKDKANAGAKDGSKSLNRRFETGVDLPAEVRSAMVILLNEQLATNSDLQSQVKQAHWNVKGVLVQDVRYTMGMPRVARNSAGVR